MANPLYSQSLMEHVTHPDFNYEQDECDVIHDGVNPSCGDTLKLFVKLNDDNTIQEVSWIGKGCAVSQGSADIMSDLVADMTIDEARDTIQLFLDMIMSKETDEELLLEKLDEAVCLKDISHMPQRVKCAELAWRTLDSALSDLQSK